jgi:hypothetical protein
VKISELIHMGLIIQAGELLVFLITQRDGRAGFFSALFQ